MKKFFTKKHSWTALLIGLFVTLFLSIFVTSFLEKALRIGQSVKSVEQSTQAYYQATSIIETQLNKNQNLRKKPWITDGKLKDFDNWLWNELNISAKSNTIPVQWKWNSRYDSNWNIISMDRPVQLVLNQDAFEKIKKGNVNVFFRVPKIENLAKRTSIDSGYSSWIIYFSIWNASDIFYLWDGNLIDRSKIWSVWSDTFVQGFQSLTWVIYKNWIKQTDNNNHLSSFSVNSGCWDSNNYLCTFKISMINPVTINWNIIPFLEYKIEDINNIPLQFMELDSKWFAGKLIRQRKVELPQITTNTALDFAVLQ